MRKQNTNLRHLKICGIIGVSGFAFRVSRFEFRVSGSAASEKNAAFNNLRQFKNLRHREHSDY
jgi:hypothetical protein